MVGALVTVGDWDNEPVATAVGVHVLDGDGTDELLNVLSSDRDGLFDLDGVGVAAECVGEGDTVGVNWLRVCEMLVEGVSDCEGEFVMEADRIGLLDRVAESVGDDVRSGALSELVFDWDTDGEGEKVGVCDSLKLTLLVPERVPADRVALDESDGRLIEGDGENEPVLMIVVDGVSEGELLGVCDRVPLDLDAVKVLVGVPVSSPLVAVGPESVREMVLDRVADFSSVLVFDIDRRIEPVAVNSLDGDRVALRPGRVSLVVALTSLDVDAVSLSDETVAVLVKVKVMVGNTVCVRVLSFVKVGVSDGELERPGVMLGVNVSLLLLDLTGVGVSELEGLFVPVTVGVFFVRLIDDVLVSDSFCVDVGERVPVLVASFVRVDVSVSSLLTVRFDRVSEIVADRAAVIETDVDLVGPSRESECDVVCVSVSLAVLE